MGGGETPVGDEKERNDATPRVAPTKSTDLMVKLLKDVSMSKLAPSTSTSLATNGVDQPSGSSPAATAELPILYTPNPGKKYACCVCENTLRRPVQFHACGHNCCSKCFTDLMA
ncbi:TNF receptor-associated factor 4 [Sparganum proliferum]